LKHEVFREVSLKVFLVDEGITATAHTEDSPLPLKSADYQTKKTPRPEAMMKLGTQIANSQAKHSVTNIMGTRLGTPTFSS